MRSPRRDGPSTRAHSRTPSAAAAHPGSTSAPLKAVVQSPIRSGSGGRASSSTSGPGSGGAGHHGDVAVIASTSAAVSRTERDTTPSVFIPTGGSMTSLVSTRPRVGLSPTSPHIAAGMRIEPEMSLAWAAGHDARRDRRRRSARRATRRPSQVPRVVGRSVEHRLGRSHQGHLGRVRAADRDQPGRAEPQRQRAVGARPEVEVAQRAHPHVVRLTGLTCLAVLEQERHAGEGAVERCVGRVAPRPLELSMDHRVECGIQPFRAGDGFVDELDRLHVAAPHELTEGGGVEICVFVHRCSRARLGQCGTRPPLTRIV